MKFRDKTKFGTVHCRLSKEALEYQYRVYTCLRKGLYRLLELQAKELG